MGAEARSEKHKTDLRCRHWKAAAMGQLLVTLIVPPIVGVVTYVVLRLIWERDEKRAGEVIRRHEPSAVSGTEEKTTDA